MAWPNQGQGMASSQVGFPSMGTPSAVPGMKPALPALKPKVKKPNPMLARLAMLQGMKGGV